MAFDFLVLILSVAGLMRTGHGRGSGLWNLLFQDGIAYFAVAFVGNLVAAVSQTKVPIVLWAVLPMSIIADTNSISMDIMFTVPAAVFSAIVAMRCVRRLSDWTGKDVYVQYVIFLTSSPTLRAYGRRKPNSSSARATGGSRQQTSGKKTNAAGPGVNIGMDTYSSNTGEISFYRGQDSTLDLERATHTRSVEEIVDNDKKYPHQASFMPIH
ncbi:hypothetical protein AG1IA_05226 [Rhizoctonia solani AG-1 IA]|uniref:Integral membrane protein n=1 Tax=Thanatephorus cucumeris (strain AG1-IA) TaxID=983506 RepID=L8WVK1_THACA|nr:hypothetical protein AG1IA_05226 [Rhizoctonia solani AG-1 IA]